MTETKSIGLHDYEAVEYTNGGRVSYVLLYKWISVGTTDHPDEGKVLRQISGKFRTIGEAFFYALLTEKAAALEAEVRRSQQELADCERQLANWQWHRAHPAGGQINAEGKS